VVVLMDLDELAGHWTLLKDERELIVGNAGRPGWGSRCC
jgi:hypothetical protein